MRLARAAECKAKSPVCRHSGPGNSNLRRRRRRRKNTLLTPGGDAASTSSSLHFAVDSLGLVVSAFTWRTEAAHCLRRMGYNFLAPYAANNSATAALLVVIPWLSRVATLAVVKGIIPKGWRQCLRFGFLLFLSQARRQFPPANCSGADSQAGSRLSIHNAQPSE